MIDIGLGHYLTLGAIIFTIGIVGIFLNRKNIIVILTVAAAEAAIGLAIIVVYFRNSGTIRVEEIDKLKG